MTRRIRALVLAATLTAPMTACDGTGSATNADAALLSPDAPTTTDLAAPPAADAPPREDLVLADASAPGAPDARDAPPADTEGTADVSLSADGAGDHVGSADSALDLAALADAVGPGRDGTTSDGGVSCRLPAILVFGQEGGMVLYRDRFTLHPDAGLRIDRTDPRGDPTGTSCTPPLPECGAPGVVSLADIVADLALPDVQEAFRSKSGTLYGVDSRPYDGPILSITLERLDPGSTTILIGDPCRAAASGCAPIPTGVARLADDLESLASAGLRTPECAAL